MTKSQVGKVPHDCYYASTTEPCNLMMMLPTGCLHDLHILHTTVLFGIARNLFTVSGIASRVRWQRVVSSREIREIHTQTQHTNKMVKYGQTYTEK